MPPKTQKQMQNDIKKAEDKRLLIEKKKAQKLMNKLSEEKITDISIGNKAILDLLLIKTNFNPSGLIKLVFITEKFLEFVYTDLDIENAQDIKKSLYTFVEHIDINSGEKNSKYSGMTSLFINKLLKLPDIILINFLRYIKTNTSNTSSIYITYNEYIKENIESIAEIYKKDNINIKDSNVSDEQKSIAFKRTLLDYFINEKKQKRLEEDPVLFTEKILQKLVDNSDNLEFEEIDILDILSNAIRGKTLDEMVHLAKIYINRVKHVKQPIPDDVIIPDIILSEFFLYDEEVIDKNSKAREINSKIKNMIHNGEPFEKIKIEIEKLKIPPDTQISLIRRLKQIIDTKNSNDSHVSIKLSGTLFDRNEQPIRRLCEYSRRPWIDGDISIWISCPPDQNITIFRKYTQSNKFTNGVKTYNGLVFYKINSKFQYLECNNIEMIQKNNILKIFISETEFIEFIIGYKSETRLPNLKQSSPKKTTLDVPVMDETRVPTNSWKTENDKLVINGFVIQDETIFNFGKRFINIKKIRYIDKLKLILKEKYNESDKQRAKHFLSVILQLVNDIPEYKEDSKYIDDIVNSIPITSETTKKDFYYKIARISAFLTFQDKKYNLEKNYTLTLEESDNFFYSIFNSYYTPEYILLLTNQEMLPEIFDDIRISEQDKENVNDKINKLIEKTLYEYASSIYSFRHPTQKIYIPIPNTVVIYDIKHKKLEPKCPIQYILYIENNVEYCLLHQDLINNFADKIYINPVTGNELSEKFITDYKLYIDRYNIIFRDKFIESLELYPITVEDSKKPKILAEFYMYTMNYIKDLEKELLGINETEENKSEDNSEENSSEDSSSEDSEDDGLNNDGDSLKLTSPAGLETSDLQSQLKNNPTEISDEKKCEYCRNIILNQSLKSVIYHKKNSRVVNFCNTKCFENKSFKK
jgi:hypothetical protein